MNLLDDLDTDPMQQRAIALIKPLISPDARDRVSRAIEQFNKTLRDQIREETRLGAADDPGHGSVPVRVVDGFPTGVARLIDRHQDEALWRLVMLQPKLGAVVEGLAGLLEHWEQFERWLELPTVAKGSSPELKRAAQVSYALQTLAVTRKVLDEVREIEEDILGVYRHDPRPACIEIYWMAHDLFAAALGVRIEDLTIVTLAHELAHAYTHLGRDADGKTWLDPGFGLSDKAVIEGLAQHYAAVVTENLGGRAPGAFDAYVQLLSHQSGPYRAHETWFNDSTGQHAEVVRYAMLRARKLGKIMDGDWRDMLKQAGEELERPANAIRHGLAPNPVARKGRRRRPPRRREF